MVCLHLLRKQGTRVLPVFINYGQRNLKKEFASLVQNLRSAGFPKPEVVDISGFGKTVQTGLTSLGKGVGRCVYSEPQSVFFDDCGIGGLHAWNFLYRLGLSIGGNGDIPDQSDQFLATAEEAIASSLGVRIWM